MGGTVPAMNRNADKTVVGAAPGPGFIWASLCSVFLFFSAHPAANTTGAPYALLDARQLRITNVASDTHVISCAGVSLDGGIDEIPIDVVLLLPDGRWRGAFYEVGAKGTKPRRITLLGGTICPVHFADEANGWAP